MLTLYSRAQVHLGEPRVREEHSLPLLFYIIAMVVKKVEEIDSPDVVAIDTTPVAMTMTPPLYKMSSRTQDVPLAISEEQLKQELEEKQSYHGYRTMLVCYHSNIISFLFVYIM